MSDLSMPVIREVNGHGTSSLYPTMELEDAARASSAMENSPTRKSNVTVTHMVTLPGNCGGTVACQNEAKKTASCCIWKSQDVAGFSLYDLGKNLLSMNFQFHVYPLERLDGLLTPVHSILFGKTLKAVRGTGLNERQIISFHHSPDKEIFRVDFLPYSKGTLRYMNVEISSENEVRIPIGQIESNRSSGVRNGAMIMDCINNRGFTTRAVNGGMEIYSRGEIRKLVAVVALGNAQRCKNQVSFTADTTSNASWESKVLLLSTLILGIVEKAEVDNGEDYGHPRLLEALLIVLIIIYIIGFFIGNSFM